MIGFRRPAAMPLALAIALAACGGVAAPTTPAATVREAFRLIDSAEVDPLIALTCDAQKETMRRQFTFSDLQAVVPGADLRQLLTALSLDTSKLTITETSIAGDKASVLIAGPMSFSFDGAQLRPILKRIADQAGQGITDAQLDLIVNGLSGRSQTVQLNSTMDVVREGGQWRLCSRMTLLQ